MTRCKSCGAQILWIRTAVSRMPCDPSPVYYRPAGKGAAMVVRPDGEVVRGNLVKPGKAVGLGYVSHFATCPDAAAHRRKGPERDARQVRMEDITP